MKGEWILAITWGALIFLLSSIPGLPGPGGYFLRLPSDKWLHFFEFGVLGFLVSRGLNKSRPMWTGITRFSVALFTCVLWAAIDEPTEAAKNKS